ncbi:MAG: hypothetical protein PHC61_01005 [Chitinivibrionales bacterium]|nr:hypothetical protein [Chitinivibrionales bacterium]
MKKIKCCIQGLYHIAIFVGLAFASWKLVRFWRTGLAEKTGQVLDVSIGVAAEKLEQTGLVLEEWAVNGQGEKLGKGIDEVLMDTKKTLEMATDLVQNVLNHTRSRR